ncbi:DUF6364 family protein [Virgibacillus sp. YIM 98842]|uniref:DUF6364 family protein n=1 Tax=Virgibacillus sp. YIM 98842 TaxID=2663533 RepID=UPI0013D9344D|nr:DUF6364 family protein [Virgibacillus sp. YIM 98842]
MEMHCSVCRQPYKDDDMVLLDEYNTVIHQSCYGLETQIQDLGTFHQVINKYDFFKQLRKKNEKKQLTLNLDEQTITNMQKYAKLHNVSVDDLVTALFIEHAQAPMETVGRIQKEQGNLDELDEFGKKLNKYLDEAAANEEDEKMAEVLNQLNKVHISKLEVLTDLYKVYEENKKAQYFGH